MSGLEFGVPDLGQVLDSSFVKLGCHEAWTLWVEVCGNYSLERALNKWHTCIRLNHPDFPAAPENLTFICAFENLGERNTQCLWADGLSWTHTLCNTSTLFWNYLLLRTIPQICIGSSDVLTWSLRFLWNPTSSLKLSKSSLDKASLGLCEVLLRVKVLSWVLKAPFRSLANWGLANLNPFLDQVWA